MSDTTTTMVGNLTRPPELKFTNNGKAVCRIAIAVKRRKGEEDVTSYFDCTVFGPMAENVANSLDKGDRVVVVGTLTQDRYEVEGKTRSSINLLVDAIGPDLRWNTAAPVRGEAPARKSNPKPVETPDDFPF